MLKSAPKNPKKSSKAVPKTTPKNTSLKKTAKRGYSHSYKLPPHVGEKALTYPPGSPERAQLAEACSVVRNETVEVPVIINGKKHYTKNVVKQLMPSDHKHVVANVHLATAPMLELQSVAIHILISSHHMLVKKLLLIRRVLLKEHN